MKRWLASRTSSSVIVNDKDQVTASEATTLEEVLAVICAQI